MEITRRGFLGVLIATASSNLLPLNHAESCPFPYEDDYLHKMQFEGALKESHVGSAICEMFDEGYNPNMVYIHSEWLKKPHIEYMSDCGVVTIVGWSEIPSNEIWVREKGMNEKRRQDSMKEEKKKHREWLEELRVKDPDEWAKHYERHYYYEDS